MKGTLQPTFKLLVETDFLKMNLKTDIKKELKHRHLKRNIKIEIKKTLTNPNGTQLKTRRNWNGTLEPTFKRNRSEEHTF